MDSIASLVNLGCSEQEAIVYMACLKSGAGPASAVAKSAKLNRTTVYPILKSLAAKGFISVNFKSRRREYRAQRPTKLAHHYQQQLHAFEALIPELNKLGNNSMHTSPGLRFIESVAELQNFYNEILLDLKGKSYYTVGSTLEWVRIDPEFFKSYWKNRAKAQIRTRVLITEDSRSINPTDSGLLRTVKYIPPQYTFKSTIDIYPSKILIVSPELSSLAVVIEIPAMTDIFKSIFELLWDSLPENKV